MKLVLQTHLYLQFQDILIKEVHSFRSRVNRVYTQFKEQKNLKENVPDNHVYIHMDFAEDCRCKSQNEIQSAYWSTTHVTIHPVVMYYKNRGEKGHSHQSFVFISSESHHDTTFIYTLIGKLVPLFKEIVPNLEMIHFWTDSQTSQYRNKKPFSKLSATMSNISTAKHHRIIWKVITKKSRAILLVELLRAKPTKQLKTEGLNSRCCRLL